MRLVMVTAGAVGLLILAGCGHDVVGDMSVPQTPRARHTVRLKPGRYTFHLGGRVDVGDKIVCVTRSGASGGGGGVPAPGRGIAASTGFAVEVSASGEVTVRCPAHPGNV